MKLFTGMGRAVTGAGLRHRLINFLTPALILGLGSAGMAAAQSPAPAQSGVQATVQPQMTAARLADERVLSASNNDEAMVGFYTLPDPLVTLDGNRVTTRAEWEGLRRAEIMHLFAVNQFGKTPEKGPEARFDVWEKAVPALNGAAKRTQVRIRFSDDPSAPVIRVLLYTPAAARGPVPVLEYLSFSPNSRSVDDPGVEPGFSWDSSTKTRVPASESRRFRPFDVKMFLDAGIGVALINYGDIDPDFEGGAALGIRSLFGPVSEKRAADEWGTIGTWSWGVSRVLDYLETDPLVDARRVALTGVSRLGKTVLWAAAQDERFAMVIPVVSGEGGAALSRRNYGETIGALVDPDRFPYWFSPNYAHWADKVDRFPVDSHMLLSLIAPRPMLLVVGSTDTWSDWRGEYLAAREVDAVYQLYGKAGLNTATEPAIGQLVTNDIGFFKHEGGHGMFEADYKAMVTYMQKHFGIAP